MADAPRFSVTVPAYNAEATLAETVASVQAQTLGDWELVICDDGSTDGTLALAERLAGEDPRIRVVSQENRGSGGAYNTAVRASRSDLLVMLSADDLLLPDHLASFNAFIAGNADAAIFTCDGYFEYEDGRRAGQDLNRGWQGASECTLTDLLSACFFGIGAVYRRGVFEAVGGFREDIYAEDYLFWLLALAQGFAHRYLDRPLAVHRRNSAQKSADAVRMRKADVFAVRTVLGSGLLSLSERRRARRVLLRLRANIGFRRLLGALLGGDRSTRVIGRLRGGASADG